MSIASLCTGDEVIKQTATRSKGSMGGPSNTWEDSDTLDCLIQEMDSRESLKYAARGSKYLFNVFFSSDPGLSVNQRLKWTVQDNAALATPIFLRILAAYREGRPGEAMLWVVDAEQETTRPEN